MSDSTVSRRDFLMRCAALGAAGSVLSACGGDSSTADGGGACSDVSALSPADAQQRQAMAQTLNYVEETPIPEKRCDNCKFWQPAEGGAACGGCQLIKGPINPAGYCTSWVAPAA